MKWAWTRRSCSRRRKPPVERPNPPKPQKALPNNVDDLLKSSGSGLPGLGGGSRFPGLPGLGGGKGGKK